MKKLERLYDDPIIEGEGEEEGVPEPPTKPVKP